MSVTLRLTRMGQRNRPVYRIIAADKQARRDGRFIEIVGFLNARTNPVEVTFKEDRIRYWVSVGAQTSLVVKNLIKKNIPGLIQEKEAHQIKKTQEVRKNRKQRAADRAKNTDTKKA